MTANTSVGPPYQLNFAYDYQGRRIEKIVLIGGVPQSTNLFLYDGWNVIAVLNSSSQLQSSFVWGNDLSGSQQGAGGVGGLVEVSYHSSPTTNCFVAYDGNGNVAALVNAGDGTVVANYEYGPFGEVIRSTGPMAKVNPFTFQTEYYDWETDKIYWKNRYYDSSLGRWLSRDPYAEAGGHNLYAFVVNSAVTKLDSVGLRPIHLEFNAFIPGPPDWLPEPGQPAPPVYWFSTDRRGFFRQPNQTARLRTEVTIESKLIGLHPPGWVLLSRTVASPSRRYDSETGQVYERTANAQGGAYLEPQKCGCQMVIEMFGKGKYPFLPPWLTPSIDYHITWTLTGEGIDRVKIHVEGVRDNFPAYEAVADWKTAIYQFRSDDAGPTPINLNTPVRFSADKEITADTGCYITWPQ